MFKASVGVVVSRRRTRPLHLKSSVNAALPVNRELQDCFLRIRTYDDFFDNGAEDHLLHCGRALIAVPDFGKMFTHPTDSLFLLRR